MSTKCCILNSLVRLPKLSTRIFGRLGLLLLMAIMTTGIFAQTSAFINQDFRMNDTNGSNIIAQAVQKIGYTIDLTPHQSFEIKDDLIWSDYILTGNKQRFYNRIALLHRWQNSGLIVRSSYYGTALDNSELTDINLNPTEVNIVKYHNKFMHQANLSGKYETGILSLSAYGSGRRMYSDPTLVYNETPVVLEKINDDAYAGAEAQIRALPELAVKIGIDHKEHIGGSYFDRTTTHVGIGYDKNFYHMFFFYPQQLLYTIAISPAIAIS